MYTFGVVMCASPFVSFPPPSAAGNVEELSRLSFRGCDAVVGSSESCCSCRIGSSMTAAAAAAAAVAAADDSASYLSSLLSLRK